MAWQLAKSGKKVLVIDADPQCNLTIHLKKREDVEGYDPEAGLEDFPSPHNKRKAGGNVDGSAPQVDNPRVPALLAGPEVQDYELPHPTFDLEPFKREAGSNIRVRHDLFTLYILYSTLHTFH